MADLTDRFSPDYATARARFIEAAHAAGFTLEAHPIGGDGPDGAPLTVDVAIMPPPEGGAPKRTVILSSGLHGVEGFFGSAVQLAALTGGIGGEPLGPRPGVRQVLIHALNPYGFAWIRRVNEDNVDLNRNFLPPGEPYAGSPAAYRDLDPMLNPPRPPSALDLFTLKAIGQILRRGFGALKDAVAGGQYDFHKGLFFGGDAPCALVELLDAHLPRWVGDAPDVLHVDFHTGLGASGTYALLVDRPADHPRLAQLSTCFGPDHLQPWAKGGVSYSIRGGLGTWCQRRLPKVEYDVITAEFGTASALKVLKALRRENQAHHYGNDEAQQRAKAALKAVFAPSSLEWRKLVMARGLAIVAQALN